MAPLKSVQLVACFPVSFVSSRGIEYKMQFFKTSYELLAPEYLPFIGHRDDIYALMPHFSRKKHYFARYFEQSREKKQKGKKKKKSEKIFQETSQSKYITSMRLANELFIHPYFLPFFYDRLYTNTRTGVPFPI